MKDTQESSSGLDLVHLLLRRVSRGFYSAKHSILLDIVLKHSAIRDDYLAQMMGLQNQEARKICGRLREDRILTMHTRPEMKEGHTRPINRTYYYIDYRDAVDAIKYRIHRLVRTIEDQSKNDFDSKGYVCPYCQRRYGALDVLSLVSWDGQHFQCVDCQTVLVDDEDSMESKVAQERLGRLQRQTKRLVSTLKEIDSSYVPDNDFLRAQANAVPPSLDLLYTDAYPHGMPSSIAVNQSVVQTTTSALGVAIDYDNAQHDGAEEKARKQAQAQANELPEWHTHSTISEQKLTPSAIGSSNQIDQIKEVPLDAAASNEVAEYYRSLKAQQQIEDDSDDHDEDEIAEEVEDNGVANTDSPIGRETVVKLPSNEGDAGPDGEEESEDEFEDV